MLVEHFRYDLKPLGHKLRIAQRAAQKFADLLFQQGAVPNNGCHFVNVSGVDINELGDPFADLKLCVVAS